MARVVIFDSGVGGLSIHQELQRKRPDIDYLFVSDNAAYPYGIKDDDELLQRVTAVMAVVINQLTPDLIVVACNTASTVALEHLRQQFSVPFVGVVPAIKPAAQLTQSGKIAVLGTPATARRSYTRRLVEEFAPHCEVRLLGSSKLVEIAETKLRGEPLKVAEIETELTPVLEFRGCDTLVLACTHFPLLNNEIRNIFKANTDNEISYIVDSGEAIARRVDSLISGLNRDSDSSIAQSSSWFTKPLTSKTLALSLSDRQLPIAGVLQP